MNLWTTTSPYYYINKMCCKHDESKHLWMSKEIVRKFWIWIRGWKFNPFPSYHNLQQTTLNIFCQKLENLYNWMDNLWLKVENIVSKGEIARFVQFFLLSPCFQRIQKASIWGKRTFPFLAWIFEEYESYTTHLCKLWPFLDSVF